jgi:hypothetical protein
MGHILALLSGELNFEKFVDPPYRAVEMVFVIEASLKIASTICFS